MYEKMISCAVIYMDLFLQAKVHSKQQSVYELDPNHIVWLCEHPFYMHLVKISPYPIYILYTLIYRRGYILNNQSINFTTSVKSLKNKPKDDRYKFPQTVFSE